MMQKEHSRAEYLIYDSAYNKLNVVHSLPGRGSSACFCDYVVMTCDKVVIQLSRDMYLIKRRYFVYILVRGRSAECLWYNYKNNTKNNENDMAADYADC